MVLIGGKLRYDEINQSIPAVRSVHNVMILSPYLGARVVGPGAAVRKRQEILKAAARVREKWKKSPAGLTSVPADYTPLPLTQRLPVKPRVHVHKKCAGVRRPRFYFVPLWRRLSRRTTHTKPNANTKSVFEWEPTLYLPSGKPRRRRRRTWQPAQKRTHARVVDVICDGVLLSFWRQLGVECSSNHMGDGPKNKNTTRDTVKALKTQSSAVPIPGIGTRGVVAIFGTPSARERGSYSLSGMATTLREVGRLRNKNFAKHT